MIDSSMIPDFIIEAHEHLDGLESSLLKLDNATVDPEVINDIFRSMHTIKGAAQFVGIERIAELSHKLENLLDFIRQGESDLNYGIINTLIAGKDRISQLVDELEEFQEEQSDITDILDHIRIHEESTSAAKHRTEASPIEKAPDKGEDEIELTDDFKELFSEQDSVKEDFTDDTTVITALAAEENIKTEEVSEDTREPVEDSASVGQGGIDLASLKDEIGSEDQEDELFIIFIEQLQENISLLRSLTENFSKAADKAAVIERCSALISSLCSSANYMGYDRLKDFYGQWITELEMNNLQLSTESDASFNFMDDHIRDIAELFPQIQDIGSDIPLPEIAPTLPVPPPQEASKEPREESEDETGEFRDLFSDLGEGEVDFDEDSQVIAVLSDEDDGFAHDTKAVTTPPDLKKIPGKDDAAWTAPDLRGEAEKLQPSPAASPKEFVSRPSRRVSAPALKKIDLAALQQEVANEDFEDDLVQIFMEQLQENITLLLEITRDFSRSTEKFQLIEQSAELVSKLHSSANYMGYEHLTEYYGQWIAELEMSDLELSSGDPVSFEFMENHIRNISHVFPQIDVAGTGPAQPESVSIPEAKPFPPDVEDEKQDDLPPADEPELAGEVEEVQEEGVIEEEFDMVKSAFADEGTPADEKESVEYLSSDDQDESAEDEFAEIIEEVDDEHDLQPEADQRRKELLEKLSGDLESLDEHSPDTLQDHDIQEVPSDDQQLFDRLSSALENKDDLPQQKQRATDEDEEDQLFIRLSSALDTGSLEQPDSPLKQIDDVIHEILTSSELSQPKARKEHHHDSIETDLNKGDDERRLNIADRRRGIEDRRYGDDVTGTRGKQIIRVDTDKIDTLVNQVGELVVNKSHLSLLYNELRNVQEYYQGSGRLDQKELKPLQDSVTKLNEANVSLSRLSCEIQDGVLDVRLVPVAKLFQRFPRLISDLTRNTDKRVELELFGENTQLDKTVIDEISDPLIHMIRNAIDHGVEPVEERKNAGKEESATILLEAYPDSNNIIIEITDDGRGIDPQSIKKKVLEKNLIPAEELDVMSDEELIHLITIPGFSTTEKTTMTSGRGVGMDVVKTNIERLNGTVQIESTPGKATTIRIIIPLTLAIIPAIGVRAGEKAIAIPLTSVEETARVRKEDIEESDGIKTISHRGQILPLILLDEILNLPITDRDTKHEYVVVVHAKGLRAGLIVDKFTGLEEAIIKPMADYLRQESGFSGASIKADGTISLILDIPTLLHLILERQSTSEQKEAIGKLLQETVQV